MCEGNLSPSPLTPVDISWSIAVCTSIPWSSISEEFCLPKALVGRWTFAPVSLPLTVVRMSLILACMPNIEVLYDAE